MRVVRGGHFWQLGSIASPATETKNFPGGACPQTPLACSHRMAVPV